MGVIVVKTYEVRCDGCDAVGPGGRLDRLDAMEEAEAEGWYRRGVKLYCPRCRSAEEQRWTKPG